MSELFEGLLDGVTDDVDSDSGMPDDSEPQPRRTRRRRSDAGKPRTTNTTTGRRTSTSKLADELLDPWSKLAKSLAFTSPTTAAVMLERGEATTQALVKIAEKHPKMLAALRRTSQVGPATDIAETVLMMVIAVQIDIGKLPPSTPIAMVLGVTKLHEQVHGAMTVDGQTFDIPESAEPPAFTYGLNNDPRNPMFSFHAGAGAGSI